MVAGTRTVSRHGQGNKMRRVICFPVKLLNSTSRRTVQTLGQQSAIVCVSGRDHHRWPETLPSLTAPLPLKQAQSGQCCLGETHGFTTSCTAQDATSWLHICCLCSPVGWWVTHLQAASQPHPSSPQAESWPNALNHKSSNFTGLLASQQVSGMTVLCSPS